MSSNASISLAEYRMEKADRRLKRRLANAQTILLSTGKYETALRLTYLAIVRYLDEVPELRNVNPDQIDTIINRALAH
jgi:hypothetical protein